MKKELKIIQREQLNEVIALENKWLQISFPNSSYNPIYISYLERPSSEELSNFLKSCHYDVEEYRITYNELSNK